MTTIPIEKGPNVSCPHCKGKATIRGSREIAPLMRDIYYRCRDDLSCGHVFVAQLVISHTITPSARPNPSIVLPSYVVPQAKPKPANENAPIPANDQDGDPAAEEIAVAPS